MTKETSKIRRTVKLRMIQKTKMQKCYRKARIKLGWRLV